MSKNLASENSRKILVAVAANDLCKTKSLSEITIEDICTKAGVSKSSFYRAFESKYDIPSWCQTFPIQQGVGLIGRSLTCQEGAMVAFEGLALFRDLFLSAHKLTALKNSTDVVRETISPLLLKTLEECHGRTQTKELLFQIDWILDASIRAAMRWLEGGMRETPGEMATLVESCYPAELKALFNAPVDPIEKESLGLDRLILLAVRE